jgi:hypothetical protein
VGAAGGARDSLVLNCEYIDVNENLTFQTVSGDLTFKFSYTFRF